MARKPNILLILVDDLRYDEFGAGGHSYMKMPHIDRIAHEGARFERAFHTTPICSPNRARLLIRYIRLRRRKFACARA